MRGVSLSWFPGALVKCFIRVVSKPVATAVVSSDRYNSLPTEKEERRCFPWEFSVLSASNLLPRFFFYLSRE